MKFSFIQIAFADELLSLAFITSNFRYLRMSPEKFEHLLTLVGPLISKRATKMRELISAAERLTLTLRMLASGDDQQSLAFSYSQGRTIVSHIPRETCSTIWMALRDIYLRPPSSPLVKQDSIVANNLGKLLIKVHRDGLRHFVEVLRRGETGASGIIGQA